MPFVNFHHHLFILGLPKIPSSPDMFRSTKIYFSSFDVSTDTSLSDKTDFISPEFISDKTEVLRKPSRKRTLFQARFNKQCGT